MTDTAKAWTHPDTVGSWIDGREVIGNGRRLPFVDPASEAQVAELAEADEAMTDRAVRSAQAAFEDGRWWRLPANDSEYGLVTYLWTDRLQDAHRTAAALQSGVVLVNTNMTLDLRFPFRGYKDSGLGREGIEGFRNFYSQDKTVTVALRPSEPMSFGRGARRVG
jgi:acyl-CoA reductase-like NAD-dependent aldehyde dehydrogenase